MLKCNNQHQCSAAKDGNGYECKSTYEMTGPYVDAYVGVQTCVLLDTRTHVLDKTDGLEVTD